MADLSTSEMHAAPLGERVSEVTVGTGDPMLSQVLLQSRRLVIRVVLQLPASKVLTGDSLVLGLPGHKALGARHGSAVRTHQLLVPRVREEAKGTLIQR